MQIFSKLKSELNEYFTDKIHVAGSTQDSDARFLKSKGANYEFSQYQMINLIDLYYNSKFETGVTDSEGQRKIFLNICKFRADVAAKQIDLDVKNFNFIPTDNASTWGAMFMSKEFKDWARENYFGELLNHCVEMFPRYGWIVMREVAGKLEFIPLQILRNQQDAKSLNEASYVILEHPNMTFSEMKEMKKWNTSKITMKDDETANVYERYGSVSERDYNEFKGLEGGSDDISYDCYSIIACDVKSKEDNGNVLFMEIMDERPFVEAHWAKQHGRLMGIGEIENQIENQIGANMSFNLYRRQLLWSAKKIFQSPDEGVSKNLVRDVKDGDVLQIAPNGNITQVDMGNRASADFNNFAEILNKNSDQKSFTYEVATGESLPSGTPFRLGVIMTNAVNSHFDMKREKLGLFFKRLVMSKLVPEFKKEFSEEHIVSVFADEPGFELLKKINKTIQINDEIKRALISGKNPDIDALKSKVELLNNSDRFQFVKLKEYFYDNVKFNVTLEITGEEVDIPKKIETLTNLYSTLQAKGDPRAEKVLARILAYTGENYDMMLGVDEVSKPAEVQSPVKASTLNQPTAENTKL